MSEARVLPLRTIARQGRSGAAKSAPGVTLSIIHPASLVIVIARKGKSKAVADTLTAVTSIKTMQAGPDQFFVEGASAAALKASLGQKASVIDQSHGRVVVRVSGPMSRAVLAKGTPVDLHEDHFPLGQSAMTQMAHVGVHITRTGVDEFTLSVFRSLSESFWEWLTASSAEFGCDVF
jgi:methylglutamate dehydrogenase subunit D